MKKQIALLPFFMISTAAVMGCSSPEEDSCNIKTPGIYVEYEVFEEGNTARAEATFWVGDKPGGTVLSLGTCGDIISVNGQNLTKSGGNSYATSLTPAENYEFTFTREDEAPYVSSVATRPPVVATAPSGESFSRTESFDITWDSNDSGQIHLEVKGDCIKSYPSVLGNNVPDNGTHTVNAGAIEPFVSSDAEKTCSANVVLTRESGGSLSSSLKGTIQGNSVGRTSFVSTP